MKKIINLTTLLSILILFSCSSNENINTKKFIYEIQEEIKIQSADKRTSSDIKHLKTVISSTIPLSSAMNLNTLEEILTSNNEQVEIIHYIDGELVLNIDIDGNNISFGPKYPNSGLCPECECPKDEDGNIKDNTDCSSSGLKQCAYSTYQQWSTSHIIVGSLTGEAQSVLSDCFSRNCLGW